MKKKITVCGSMVFFKEMLILKDKLEHLGFKVFIPSIEGTDKDYSSLSKKEQISLKHLFINDHIDKIKKSESILIANYTKNGQTHYIGANTFLEMAFAYILEKDIFILNEIPQQANTLEIEALKPIVLKTSLTILQNF